MKLLKYFSLSTLALVGLGACNELNGVLHITDTVTLNETYHENDIEAQSTRPLELVPGDYEAKISGSSDKLVVTLKSKNSAQLVFKTGGTEVPVHGGPVDLPSKISGQPVDVKGQVDENMSESENRRENESCIYYRRVLQCSGPYGNHCWWTDQPYPGRRFVEYFVRTTTQVLSAHMLKPDSDISMGQLDGSRSQSEKIYTYTGPCR